MKRWLALLLCITGCAPAVKVPGPERWVVYYDSKLPAEAFKGYQLVVFDRRYHPDVKAVQAQGSTVLAYVSAGEAHGEAKQLAELQKEKAIFKPNKQWGSHVVNLTSARWRSVVMEQVADALNQGFDGVMLDTLDSALHVADQTSAEIGKANREAAVTLVKEIRATFPYAKIMINRGFSVLPDAISQLDFILAESVLAETNVSTGQSKLFSHTTYHQVIAPLLRERQKLPQLKIYSLGYWKPDDVEGIQFIYATQRKYNFIPYVTAPDLRTLSLEPHRQQTRHDSQPIAPDVEEDLNA